MEHLRNYRGNIELDKEQKEEIYWEMDKIFKKSTLIDRIFFLRGEKMIAFGMLALMIFFGSMVLRGTSHKEELCSYYVVYNTTQGTNVGYVTGYYLQDETAIIRKFSEQGKTVTYLKAIECD